MNLMLEARIQTNSKPNPLDDNTCIAYSIWDHYVDSGRMGGCIRIILFSLHHNFSNQTRLENGTRRMQL